MSAKGSQERGLEERIAELERAGGVDLDDVVEFLVALPDETAAEHRTALEKLVTRVPDAVEPLRTLLDQEGLVFEDANARTLRFGAFLALQAHYRRTRDLSAIDRLHQEYDHRFSDRPMYEAARAEHLRIRGGPDDYDRAVRTLESVVEEVPDNPWLQHALAETVVEGLEDDALPDTDREERRRRAREAVDEAIERRPEHPTYHVTKGRLLALEGEFDRARAEIERGIHLTDPAASDYALRTARFQRHLLAVEVREGEDRLDRRLAEAEDRIDDLHRRTDAAIEEVEDRSDEVARELRKESDDVARELRAESDELARELREESDDVIDELREESDEVVEDLRSRVDGTLQDLQHRAEEVRDGFRNASLQFLGFFTAVLAAVVTTVQIATNYGPRPAGALILMVFGGLTASMGAFAGLVASDDGGPGGSELTMILAGIGVLALGYVALLVV